MRYCRIVQQRIVYLTETIIVMLEKPKLFLCTNLQCHEHQYLGGHHAQEHGERIYRGVGYRGLVVAAYLVAVGKGGRVGHGTRDESGNGEVAELALHAGHDADDEAGDDGDEEAVEYPPVTTTDDGVDEAVAGTDAHRGEEEGDANLTYHLVGRRGGVGDQLQLGAKLADEDGHDERTACETKLHGHGHVGDEDGQRAQHHTEGDAEEDGCEVGLLETLDGVAHEFGYLLYALGLAHHNDAVAQLEQQVGLGDEVDTGTADARDGDVEGLAQLEVAQALAVDGGVGDDEALGSEVVGLDSLPLGHVHVNARTDEEREGLDLERRGHEEDLIAHAEGGVRLGQLDVVGALMEHAGDHTLTAEELLYLADGVAAHGVVVHLKGDGFEMLGILLVALHHDAALIVEVDTEDALEHDDAQDNTYHTQGIGHGIALRDGGVGLPGHVVEGLLGGTHTGGVGHRTAEHADHADEVGTRNKMYGIGRAAAQQHDAGSQHVECDASLAERGEEAGAHLQADGVDEEDEAELLDEVGRGGIEQEAEMPGHDTHEEYPGDTQRHAAKLDAIEAEADGDDHGHDEHRVGYATTGEEVD